jgi:adenylosuccinate synthase
MSQDLFAQRYQNQEIPTNFNRVAFPEIKVAVQYRYPDTKEIVSGFPADLQVLENIEVEYVTLKGWLKPIGQCRSFYDLPLAVSLRLHAYNIYIAELANSVVSMLSMSKNFLGCQSNTLVLVC